MTLGGALARMARLSMSSQRLVKLTPPGTEGAVERARLHAELDRARAARPIIWLGARAGAGKTTLASTWAAAHRLPCIWYQVGDEDDDVATFFYHLGLAARPLASDRPPMPLLTLEDRRGLAAFSRLFFQELFDRLPHPSVLVFDNADAGAWQVALASGLDLIPPETTVLLLGRGELPAAFARHLGRRQVTIIDPDQLLLTDEESQSFARLTLGKRALAPDLGARIFRLAAGWAAGLVFLLEWVRRAGAPPPEDLAEAGSLGLFEYFATEVLARIDPETQKLLLETSLLPSVTARAAAEVTGLPHAGRMLAGLSRQNFFTQGGGDAFSYHGAFRAFLRDRLRATRSPEALRQLAERCARILIEAGQIEEAVPLLLDADCPDAVAAILRQRAPGLASQGRTDTLAAWLAALPDEQVARDAWLVYWRGVCRLPTSIPEARRILSRALEQFVDAGDAEGAYAAWVALVEADGQYFADLAVLDERLATHARITARFPTIPTPALAARVEAARFIALSCHRPSTPGLEELAERLLPLVCEHGDATTRLNAGQFILLYYSCTGADARARLARAQLAVGEDAPVPTPVRVLWLTAQAVHLACDADLEQAQALLDRALILWHRGRGSAPAWRQLLCTATILAAERGDLAEARRHIATMREIVASGEPALPLGIDVNAIHIFLEEDDQRRALALARAAVIGTQEAGFEFSHLLAVGMLAAAHVAAGQLEEGRRVIESGLARARAARSARLELLFLFVDAARALAAREPGAREQVRRALAYGRERGFATVRPGVPRVLIGAVCRAAAEDGMEIEFVRRLVRTHDVVLPEPPLHAPAWPWKLEVRALGRFALTLDGAPLRSARKEQRRPLALLKALVAFGERDVAEAALENALWPDAEGDSAHDALEINVRRLRRLCDDSELLSRHGGNLGLDQRRVWTDVRALEDVFRALDTPPSGDDAALAARLFALYRGDFLRDEEEPWILPVRERLRAQFARRVCAVAGRLERRGAWDEALDHYERALQVAALVEPLHQGMIRVLHAMGRRSEAQQASERCRVVLARGQA